MDHTDQQTKAMTTAGLNLIAQALSIYDRDLRLAVANRPFQVMFNLPKALVTPGARFEDTIRHLAETGEYGEIDDLDAFVEVRVKQARAFEPHYMERTRANGRTISVEGSPLPEGGWVTVYTDITRAKRSEQLLHARSEELTDKLIAHAEDLSTANRELEATNAALQEAKHQLTENEARTRLTTEMMPVHIAHVNADGIYTYSNRRLSSVMPGRPRDIVGRPISEIMAAAFARIEPNLKNAFAGQSSTFEFTDDHSSRRIRAAFTPDGAGGVYILSMDITEETQTRVALQQTRRRALAGQMTSGLAHDFSNLLTIILGTQGKLARMALDDEARALIEATLGAARRGGRLLNRLGDMTGHRTLRPHPTDLHAFLSDLKLLISPILPPVMGLSVLDNTPDGPVLLDAAMLQDALLNLVLNARDACGTNGQITISAHTVASIWIEITVTDTGPGFSKKALDHALDPFFTTKGGEGSGLGLPMVYDMVKLAGGDLRLTDTPSGANVTLRLPYRVAPHLSEGLVLLVEDSAEVRLSVREMLTELGHAVIEAESVEEALSLLADVPDIDVVLSDIQLVGDLTGLDLAKQMATGTTPCVLMTSLPADDTTHLAAAATSPVLQKPFTASQLAAAITFGADA